MSNFERPPDPARARLLAQLLRAYRIAMGLSQADVVRAAGISPTTVAEAEKLDPRSKIPLSSFYKLCIKGLAMESRQELFAPLIDLYGPDEPRYEKLRRKHPEFRFPPGSRSRVLAEILHEVHEGVAGLEAPGRLAGETVMYTWNSAGDRALDDDLHAAESVVTEMLSWSGLPSSVLFWPPFFGDKPGDVAPLPAISQNAEHFDAFRERVEAMRQQVYFRGRRSILSIQAITAYVDRSDKSLHRRGPWLVDLEHRRRHIQILIDLLRRPGVMLDVRLDEPAPPQELLLAGLDAAVLRFEPLWSHTSQSIPSTSHLLLLKLMLEFELKWEALSRTQSRAWVVERLYGILGASNSPMVERYRDRV